MSAAPVFKPTLPADDVVRCTRVGDEYQVDSLPVADPTAHPAPAAGAAGDLATLIWAPLGPDSSSSASGAAHGGGDAVDGVAGPSDLPGRTLAFEHAAYLRRWAAFELQDEALEKLFGSHGDLLAANAAMADILTRRNLPRLPQAEVTRSAALGSAIVAHRKDFYRAKCSLSAAGVAVSIGQLQHFFYGQFRYSVENKYLSAARKAEAEQDGFDDFCSQCGLPGLLICCDMCSAVYHLPCAGLKPDAVPEGDWMCPTCTAKPRPPPPPAPARRPGSPASSPHASPAHPAARAPGRPAASRADSPSHAANLDLAPVQDTAAWPFSAVMVAAPNGSTLGVASSGALAGRVHDGAWTPALASGSALSAGTLAAAAALLAAVAPQTGASPALSQLAPITEGELPPGWQCEERTTNSGRTYKTYAGPNEAKAQSVPHAWKKHAETLSEALPDAKKRKGLRGELLPGSLLAPRAPAATAPAALGAAAAALPPPAAPPNPASAAAASNAAPSAPHAAAAGGLNAPLVFQTTGGRAYTADGWCE